VTSDIELATGVQLHYEERGDGSPLVLLYGAGGDHRCWRPQMGALSARHRLIMPDLRGSGTSGAPEGEWTLRTYAEDVVALLDVLGVDAADVAGMSMGSAVAQHLLIDWPERVRRAVMMNTWGRTDARLTLLWNHILFLQGLVGAADDPEPHLQDLVDLNLALFFSPHALESRRDVVDDWWETYGGGVQEEGSAKHFRSLMAHDTLNALTSVQRPVLVIGGEEDYHTPYYSRQVAELIPGAKWHLLDGPGSSHGMHWERPDDINRLVLEFLAT
jgi:pimeloyl-ACP methyl ester carboxylesterase